MKRLQVSEAVVAAQDCKPCGFFRGSVAERIEADRAECKQRQLVRMMRRARSSQKSRQAA